MCASLLAKLLGVLRVCNLRNYFCVCALHFCCQPVAVDPRIAVHVADASSVHMVRVRGLRVQCSVARAFSDVSVLLLLLLLLLCDTVCVFELLPAAVQEMFWQLQRPVSPHHTWDIFFGRRGNEVWQALGGWQGAWWFVFVWLRGVLVALSSWSVTV